MSKKSKNRSNSSNRNVSRQTVEPVEPVETPKTKLSFSLVTNLLIYCLIDKALGYYLDQAWNQLFKFGKYLLAILLNFGLFPLMLHAANKHGWGYVAFSCVGALIPYFIAKNMGRGMRPKETIQIFKMFGVVWCVWWTIVFQLDPLFAVFTIIWIVLGSLMEFSYQPFKALLAKKYKDLLDTRLS